jgi:type I restriction enzyme, R subunit
MHTHAHKKTLSERDICTQYLVPALVQAGWDLHRQVREEVTFTRGRVIVRGKLHSRGQARRADFILYHQPNLPLAVIEAKVNTLPVGAGMQQALDYADALGVPFVFSSNGDGFLFHDRTGTGAQVETALTLDQFPGPDELWRRYCQWKGLDASLRRPVEAIASGQNRVLLVMATGTGKTYTAFQIIWRLWKSRQKRRILFLADRNILVDQTRNNNFKPFVANTFATGI